MRTGPMWSSAGTRVGQAWGDRGGSPTFGGRGCSAFSWRERRVRGKRRGLRGWRRPRWCGSGRVIWLRCRGRFASVGLFKLTAEAFDAAGGIHQLLLAGKEGMAGGADFENDVALVGRAGLEVGSTGALDVGGFGSRGVLPVLAWVWSFRCTDSRDSRIACGGWFTSHRWSCRVVARGAGVYSVYVGFHTGNWIQALPYWSDGRGLLDL